LASGPSVRWLPRQVMKHRRIVPKWREAV